MTEHIVHAIMDRLEVLICGLDVEGSIRLFNRPCERVTGISRDAAIGQSWLELFARGPRSEHVQTLWSQARTNGPAGPFEALCRNGRNLRWHFSLHDHEALPRVALWAVGVDVTDEREALVRARELERIIALGNLVSGLTHELRNPLNAALLQLALADRNLARRRDAEFEPIAAAVTHATSEVRRISRILDDFLVFVRPQPLQLQRADPRRIVTRAIERSAPRASAAGVTVSLDPGADTLAELDVALVESAVYQLITNAIDAVAETADRIVHVRIAASGNTIAFEVEDHGLGMPSAETPAFEPFFTTKTGGTGLGLSIVERVASDHGGSIAYERRGDATVFRLELPIVGGVVN